LNNCKIINDGNDGDYGFGNLFDQEEGNVDANEISEEIIVDKFSSKFHNSNHNSAHKAERQTKKSQFQIKL
jgi:hypothetical protein